MSIVKSFDDAFKRMEEKNWDYIYVLVDIHGTIFIPSYNNKEHYAYYPYAEKVLRKLSDNPRVMLILWSSTKRKYLNDYFTCLANDGIYVDYFNVNPEVTNDDSELESADFSVKPYFNVGIDDKFGFDPMKDWKAIYDYLNSKEIIDGWNEIKDLSNDELKKRHDFMKEVFNKYICK